VIWGGGADDEVIDKLDLEVGGSDGMDDSEPSKMGRPG
jgi:hypothetical protein